ncbi:sigma-70 family RNA polymerase sigma factor [Pseudenhygromyxa sp. WMMC2535]|uniref:RNA polymerase sigma factor n=1 Tax=Pseudenhygromyxa sp. WMMC2535 TaxID=2712867 RepID=UPI0023DDCF0E|nr:sigma-70 family RNA polymerase sigma factor [Pseudenhygromyxa sp. WMMC2535]
MDLVSVYDLDPGPSSVIAERQEQRLLLEGLRAISVNYQVVLELHYWEQLSTKEIAAVLGVPAGTVRSRLQRAREALEAAIGALSRSPAMLESTLTRLDDWAQHCAHAMGGRRG